MGNASHVTSVAASGQAAKTAFIVATCASHDCPVVTYTTGSASFVHSNAAAKTVVVGEVVKVVEVMEQLIYIHTLVKVLKLVKPIKVAVVVLVDKVLVVHQLVSLKVAVKVL